MEKNFITFLKEMQNKYPLAFAALLDFESKSDSMYGVLNEFFKSKIVGREMGIVMPTWEPEFQILEEKLSL